jgi:hypothetical protein
VVLTGDSVDIAATERRRADRPPSALFHRHDYMTSLA